MRNKAHHVPGFAREFESDLGEYVEESKDAIQRLKEAEVDPPTSKYGSVSDIVIEYSAKIEALLENKFGARGSGLRNKTENVADKLPHELVQTLIWIAEQRNNVVHEPDSVQSFQHMIDGYVQKSQDAIGVLKRLDASSASRGVLVEPTLGQAISVSPHPSEKNIGRPKERPNLRRALTVLYYGGGTLLWFPLVHAYFKNLNPIELYRSIFSDVWSSTNDVVINALINVVVFTILVITGTGALHVGVFLSAIVLVVFALFYSLSQLAHLSVGGAILAAAIPLTVVGWLVIRIVQRGWNARIKRWLLPTISLRYVLFLLGSVGLLALFVWLLFFVIPGSITVPEVYYDRTIASSIITPIPWP
jgi:hypothetical protein